MTTADAVVAVTPVFAASYSGLFKTFVDVLEPDALAGTPVLLAATAGTARHSLVIEHAMRPLFSYLRALTVPTGVFAAPEDWAQGDAAPLADRIRRAAAELADLMTPPRAGGRGRPVREPRPLREPARRSAERDGPACHPPFDSWRHDCRPKRARPTWSDPLAGFSAR